MNTALVHIYAFSYRNNSENKIKRTNHNTVKRDVTEMPECRRQRKTKRLCFELRVGMSLKAEALHTNNILSYWIKVVNVYTLVLFSIIDGILCKLRSVPRVHSRSHGRSDSR